MTSTNIKPELRPVGKKLGPDSPRARHQRRRTLRVKAALCVLDVTAVITAFLLALLLHRGGLATGLLAGHGVTGVVVLGLWVICLERAGLYDSRHVMARAGEFHAIVQGATRAVLFTVFFAFVFDLNVAKPTMLYAFPLAIVLLATEREIVRRQFIRLRQRRRFLRRVIILGANEEGRALADDLAANPGLGYRSIGFVDDQLGDDDGLRILGPIDDVVEIARAAEVSGVMISPNAIGSDECARITRELIGLGVNVELLSTLQGVAATRMVPRPLGAAAVVALDPARQLGWRAVAKRSFDVVAAASALVVLAPLMALVAVAIKLGSEGPVVFRQQRVGRDGARFTLLKFRSMVDGAEHRIIDLRHANEADGPLFKIREDPRVTAVGRFIRRWSIDELPQLVNVLRGDMSIVGPRPALPDEVEHWDATLYHRLRVRPGLTGMWQVAGRSEVSFEEYARLDLYYVDNWSLVTDLSLVLRTLPVLFRARGAY